LYWIDWVTNTGETFRLERGKALTGLYRAMEKEPSA